MMVKINFDFDKNYISKKEPLSDTTPEELYELIDGVSDEGVLAYVFAGVFNQGEYLLYLEEWECESDEERERVHERYLENRELELTVLEKILPLIGITAKRDEPPLGYYHAVAPFMRKNGFLAKNNVFVKIC